MSLGDVFAWPEALPILLAPPATWLLFAWLDRRSAARFGDVAGARGPALARELDRDRRRGRNVVFAAGLAFAGIALLQPLFGVGGHPVEQRGVDILVCLDVSRSMLARDLAPSRLAAAQREIRALAERARGDRLGLVAFAGAARVLVPLTQDGDSFAALADLADPLSVPRGGTDLGAALRLASDVFSDTSGEHEAVILITDGDDPDQRGLRMAETLRGRGITVHCVGVGSPAGSKITIDGPSGEAFLKDAAGNDVVSAMDPAALRRIAETTQGSFVDANTLPRPLVSLYEDRIVPMARKAFAGGPGHERDNRFQWPLLLALLLWMLETAWTDRRTS